MSDNSDDAEILREQQAIIEEFAFLGEWMDRYQHIIDMGRKLPDFPEEWKTEENRLHGCQSQVWLHAEQRDGRVYFQAISDSAIVSGLIALLLRVYSGRRPEDILRTPPDFIAEIGLARHLSPTRSNGLHAMVQAIRNTAGKYLEDRAAATQDA